MKVEQDDDDTCHCCVWSELCGGCRENMSGHVTEQSYGSLTDDVDLRSGLGLTLLLTPLKTERTEYNSTIYEQLDIRIMTENVSIAQKLRRVHTHTLTETHTHL